jgi:MscS family membrane protein
MMIYLPINTLKILIFLLFILPISSMLQAEISPAQAIGLAPLETNKQADKTDTEEVIPKTLQSPRATMATFIHAMNDIKRGDSDAIKAALTTLDLSDINALVAKEHGTALAWKLLEVIDKTRFIKFSDIPKKIRAEQWVFERYGVDKDRQIVIKQQDNGHWLFSVETLQQLPEILKLLKTKANLISQGDDDTTYQPWTFRLQKQLPEILQNQLIGLKYWQWLGILLFIVLGILVDWLFSKTALVLTRLLSKRTEIQEYRDLPNNIFRPLGLMAMALVWWLGINQLTLPENALLILLVAVKFLTSVAGVWGVYRLVDLVSAWMQHKAIRTETKVDDAIGPWAGRTLKVLVTVIGLVFIANNLNINITGLVAGLGLGGLALALASKDLAQNLFGTVTVLVEGTFSVGDWIVVGDIEGTVEDISFRSTRIRTFYNSLITLPNANLITSSVDNFGKRRYRRMSHKLKITYHTPPDKIEAFCEGIREIVRLHPYMRKDYYQVYFNGYSDSALEILVYVFWETPDWNTELREKHRFLLDVLRLANRMQVDFAYPTQTVFLKEMQESEPMPKAEESQHTEEACTFAQSLAREIVEENISLGKKPDPVSIPQQPLSQE